MKYAWIAEHRDWFPIAVMCDVLRVSTSGYYASRDRTPGPRAQRQERIQQVVQQVHAESYGSMAAARSPRCWKPALTWSRRAATPWPLRCGN